MNNQFFNIKRFGRLAAYDLKTNYKTYLITLLAAFIGFSFLILLGTVSYNMGSAIERNDFRDSMDYQASFVFCLIAYFVYVGLSFPAFSSKKATMNYILLPASSFEKYLLEILLKIVLAFGFFLLIYYVSANLVTNIKEVYYNHEYAELVAKYGNKVHFPPFTFGFIYDNIYLTGDTIDKLSVLGTYYVSSILLFLFSIRLYFKRFALIKTAVAGLAFIYLSTELLNLLGRLFTGNEKIAYDFHHYFLYYDYLAIFACITLLFLGYYITSIFRLPK